MCVTLNITENSLRKMLTLGVIDRVIRFLMLKRLKRSAGLVNQRLNVYSLGNVDFRFGFCFFNNCVVINYFCYSAATSSYVSFSFGGGNFDFVFNTCSSEI